MCVEETGDFPMGRVYGDNAPSGYFPFYVAVKSKIVKFQNFKNFKKNLI